MSATAYYIGTTSSGEHALYRLAMDKGVAGTPEELVEGVEDMQVLYGVDPSWTPTSHGPPVKYVTADKVTDFKQVVSVRLGLLVDTTTDVTTSKDNQTYTIADTTIQAATGTHQHPKDNKLRFPITTTIKLRNR